MRRTRMWAVSMITDHSYPWCIFCTRDAAKEAAADGGQNQQVFPVEVEFNDKPRATARALPKKGKR